MQVTTLLRTLAFALAIFTAVASVSTGAFAKHGADDVIVDISGEGAGHP